MIKFFCDACQAQIKEGERNSKVETLEEKVDFSSTDQKDRLQQVSLMLCEKCTDKVKETVNKIASKK